MIILPSRIFVPGVVFMKMQRVCDSVLDSYEEQEF